MIGTPNQTPDPLTTSTISRRFQAGLLWLAFYCAPTQAAAVTDRLALLAHAEANHE